MGIGNVVRQALKDMIRWALDEPRGYGSEEKTAYPSSIGRSSSLSSNDLGNGLNFTVYPATGGKVVKFQTYDPKTDRSTQSLYIVTDKEDLGDELGVIITKESLCR